MSMVLQGLRSFPRRPLSSQELSESVVCEMVRLSMHIGNGGHAQAAQYL